MEEIGNGILNNRPISIELGDQHARINSNQ
jgi:hypothetical protein